MTPAQLRAMQDGRRKASVRRHREGIARVRAFQAYLKRARPVDGRWPRIPMPAIPTDSDYEAARSAGMVA